MKSQKVRLRVDVSEENNVVDIHTSGHADRDTIKKVIEIVNPKDEVIVINKEADASLL